MSLAAYGLVIHSVTGRAAGRVENCILQLGHYWPSFTVRRMTGLAVS